MEPVTVEVTCGEDRHRLSWRRGKLVLDDHDLAAEMSFVALGGEPALCLEVLRAWRAGVDDRRVLWFWDAPQTVGADMATMMASVRSRHQQLLARQRGGPGRPSGPVRVVVSRGGRSIRTGGPVPAAGLGRMQEELTAEYHRALLSALPDELRLRLGLSAVVRAERRRGDWLWFRTRAAELESALGGRARPAFEACMRAWRGRVAHHAVTVECWIAGPGETAGVCGLMDDAGAWAAARLPLRWLVDVWSRGVAVVDGCFVVAVDAAEDGGSRLAVTAVRWERRLPGGSTPVVEPAVAVRAGDGRWCLRWAG